jgi:hypothetical protein
MSLSISVPALFSRVAVGKGIFSSHKAEQTPGASRQVRVPFTRKPYRTAPPLPEQAAGACVMSHHGLPGVVYRRWISDALNGSRRRSDYGL